MNLAIRVSLPLCCDGHVGDIPILYNPEYFTITEISLGIYSVASAVQGDMSSNTK